MSRNTRYGYYRNEITEDEEYEERRREAYRKYILKKKRKQRARRRFVLIGILVSIVVGIGLGKMQTELTNTLNIMVRKSGNDIDDVDVSNIDLVSDDKIINVLLVGSDHRENQTEAGRSDSLMIATLDMKHGELKLTSIMRDTYVTIPGYLDNRFNAAYSYGGIPLLYQTIATNFMVRLDGYVMVDFDAFTSVIDAIGGVEVTITQSEYEHLMDYYKKRGGDALKLLPGTNNMTGNQALCYSRIRKEGNGDFRRTERQRTVMQAIFKKAKTMSLGTLYDTVKAVMPYISTDLSNEEILSYMVTVLKMGTTEIEQFRIPVDGTFENQKIRGMQVLVPNMEENARLLQEFLYN